MNLKFWLSVASLISQIGLLETASTCQTAEYSIGGMFLRGHTFKTSKVELPKHCYLKCVEEAICQSYNFVIDQSVCELNNRTKEARPKDFLRDQTRYYMKRAKSRGTPRFFLFILYFYFKLTWLFLRALRYLAEIHATNKQIKKSQLTVLKLGLQAKYSC